MYRVLRYFPNGRAVTTTIEQRRAPDTEDTEVSAPIADLTTHPIGFWFFFWGEFAERCSYYGMRAILPLYMTTRLAMPDDQASSWYSWFKAACYFLPLMGGYFADRWLGKYWTIVGFSIPYVIGQLIIGIESRAALIVALTLLAWGSGVIKPNISSLMGLTYDQQRPGVTRLRASAFLWFYFSINVGSTLSMLALPTVRDRAGYQIAFIIPAVLMAVALTVFAAGKRHYAVERRDSRTTSSISIRDRWRQLAPLFGIFGLLVFYWVAYEHNDSLWVFFARDHIDRRLPTFLGGAEVAADQFQFINAALILAFVPFSQWFWPRVDPTGKRFPHTTKILIGFLFTVTAPLIMAAAASIAEGGAQVSVLWLVAAYFTLTIGEVLVYGTGLDLTYAFAPPDMKGFVTACFLETSALANLINVQFSPLYATRLSAGHFYLVDAAIVLVAAIAFYFVGKKFNSLQNAIAKTNE